MCPPIAREKGNDQVGCLQFLRNVELIFVEA